MTVRENMGFSLKIAGLTPVEIAPRVGEAAKTLDLTHLLDRRPSQLSGGQIRPVAGPSLRWRDRQDAAGLTWRGSSPSN